MAGQLQLAPWPQSPLFFRCSISRPKRAFVYHGMTHFRHSVSVLVFTEGPNTTCVCTAATAYGSFYTIGSHICMDFIETSGIQAGILQMFMIHRYTYTYTGPIRPNQHSPWPGLMGIVINKHLEDPSVGTTDLDLCWTYHCQEPTTTYPLKVLVETENLKTFGSKPSILSMLAWKQWRLLPSENVSDWSVLEGWSTFWTWS